MSTSDLATAAPVLPAIPSLAGILRRQVIARLTALDVPLVLIEHGHEVLPSRHADAVRVTVHDPRFWWSIALDGTNGAGDSYAESWWTCSDLYRLVRILARSQQVVERIDGGLARLVMPLFRLANALRRNTRRGAAENIHAHYDLGNAFFARWLDPGMTYSSAVFADPATDLHHAQTAKIDLLLDRVGLRPGEHLVEIGTGWGELALRAAARGARVTTVTISREQHALATRRIAEAGFADRVTVRLCDYRDLDGTYDRLVSVEMIEAVGREYYPTFFRTVSRLLKPHGSAVIQAITIPDQRFLRAAKEADFIKRRIFPGCCIPSIEALLAAMCRTSDLTLVAMEDFAAHYARTLELWRSRFLAHGAALDAEGYDARFRRLWEFYLAYCAGGFAERALGVAHLVFAKPGWRAADHAAIAEVDT